MNVIFGNVVLSSASRSDAREVDFLTTIVHEVRDGNRRRMMFA